MRACVIARMGSLHRGVGNKAFRHNDECLTETGVYPGEVRVFIRRASARLGLGDVKDSLRTLDWLLKNSERWCRRMANKLESLHRVGKVVHLCRM